MAALSIVGADSAIAYTAICDRDRAWPAAVGPVDRLIHQLLHDPAGGAVAPAIRDRMHAAIRIALASAVCPQSPSGDPLKAALAIHTAVHAETDAAFETCLAAVVQAVIVSRLIAPLQAAVGLTIGARLQAVLNTVGQQGVSPVSMPAELSPFVPK
jgi:hypothetical protein